jgi:Calcipressin
MLVLATDGIQLNHMQEEEEEEEEEPPPKSLIVTNVDLSVFLDDGAKKVFEAKFRVFDQSVVFYYFRTFRRVRVDFMSHSNASLAKTKVDGVLVGDNTINCYFIRVFAPSDPEEVFLQPPPLEKQFLISPPCSPPVGWEQPREGGPVVDYDLMAALAQLAPGEHHELHPSNSGRQTDRTPMKSVPVIGREQQRFKMC